MARSPARYRWSRRLMLSSAFWSWTSRHSAGVRTDWLTRRPSSQSCRRKAATESRLARARRSEANSSSRSMSEYGNRWRRPYPPTASKLRPSGTAASRLSEAARTQPSTCAERSARVVDGCKKGSDPFLQGGFATVVVADANGLGHVEDEDFAVADLAGAGGPGKRLNHFFGALGGNHHFELHLGQEVHVVLLAAIDFLVTLLAAVAAHIGDGHAIDADGHKRLLHFVEFEGLDDGFDFLHELMIRGYTLP